ncbi:hypothetical protein LINPERPRIM_LOCUS12100 [Linum perenne]
MPSHFQTSIELQLSSDPVFGSQSVAENRISVDVVTYDLIGISLCDLYDSGGAQLRPVGKRTLI